MAKYLEERLEQLEKQVSRLESSLKQGVLFKDAAKTMGISYSTLSQRVREAIANPELSALKEGIHFDSGGRNRRILDVVEAQKAIAQNDVTFGRKKLGEKF
jgi:hypothetical protein